VRSTGLATRALAADGVNLVDENDGGRLALGLLEQVAHTARTDADEHFDELRARDIEERHPSFAGDGAAYQRFARTWRANEQYALGNPRAHCGEAVRRLEELDDLAQLLFRFGRAGDVIERHALRLADEASCAAASERAAVAGAPHRKHQRAQHRCGQQGRRQDLAPGNRRLLLDRVRNCAQLSAGDAYSLQHLWDRRFAILDEHVFGVIGVQVGSIGLYINRLRLAAFDDRGCLAGGDWLRRGMRRPSGKVGQHDQGHGREDQHGKAKHAHKRSSEQAGQSLHLGSVAESAHSPVKNQDK
jgi:hypothetical protein